MNINKIVLCVVCSVIFSGCSIQNCDPKYDNGFFTKLGCAVGGTYSKRVDLKQQKVNELQEENERLEQLKKDFAVELAVAKDDANARRQALNNLNKKLELLEQDLKKKNSASEDLKTLNKKIADYKEKASKDINNEEYIKGLESLTPVSE